MIEEICRALVRGESIYTLPFRFTTDNGNKTSHYEILVTRNPFSYELMKSIMSRCASGICDDPTAFEFNPVTASRQTGIDKNRDR